MICNKKLSGECRMDGKDCGHSAPHPAWTDEDNSCFAQCYNSTGAECVEEEKKMTKQEKIEVRDKCLSILRKKLKQCYHKDRQVWILNDNAMWYAITIAAELCVKATYASMDKEDKCLPEKS